MRLSHTLLMAGSVVACGCASAMNPLETGIPLAGNPSPGWSAPSIRPVVAFTSPDWNGTATAPIRPAGYQYLTPGQVATPPQSQFAVNQDCGCEPTTSTRGPIRRYLRAVLMGDDDPRPLRPTPVHLTPVAYPATASVPPGAIQRAIYVEETASTSDGPILRPVAMQSSMPSQPPAAMEPVAPRPRAPLPSSALHRPTEEASVPPGPPVHVVNERSIRLNAKLRDVGPSGVAAVDLWFTRDGQHWQKGQKPLPAQPPFVLHVKEDGRYGITLVPRSGVGIGRQPPMLGEPPQVWIDVDTAAPVVKLNQVDFLMTEKGREVSITWAAEDRNLCSRPIRLSYGQSAQGPWQTIAETENSGSFRWTPPAQMPSEFFVRVEATDVAGNVGAACSDAPVVMDLSRPALEIVSVEGFRKR